MKPSFCNHVNCLRAGVAALMVWSGLQFASTSFAQPVDTYLNTGLNFVPWPQIDAVNFVNTGTLMYQGLLPWESSDTLNFTNSGTISGSTGFRFDLSPVDTGLRQWASQFINRPAGTGGAAIISADEAEVPVTVGLPNESRLSPCYLYVSATNIVNRGTMMAGANGVVQLEGRYVDLSRGLLEITPIPTLGSINDRINGQYTPDVGIYDFFWGTTNMTFYSGSLWDGLFANSPNFGLDGTITNRPDPYVSIYVNKSDSYSNAFIGTVFVATTNIDGSVVSNRLVVATNIVKQAVFVAVPDPNIFTIQIGFTPSPRPGNRFQTTSVILSAQWTNPITALLDTASLFFQDTLASDIYIGELPNIVNGSTFRPANYLMERGGGAVGNPGQGRPDVLFFYNQDTMTNAFAIDSPYAGYSALVDNIVSRAPSIPAGTETNYPGRVRISGDTVDLSRARLRGEGEIVVNTPHLVGSIGAIVDCENLSYTLGSTNGYLVMTNLTKPMVNRLTGRIKEWSSVWSNTATERIEFTNNYVFTTVTNGTDPDTGDPIVVTETNLVSVFYTNDVALNFHVWMLDATLLNTTLPVTVFDLVTHSTNAVLNDNMTVVKTLNIDGTAFTINGGLALSSKVLPNAYGGDITVSVPSWTHTNAPNMLYFTNNGFMSVPSEAHFGSDFSPYDPLAPSQYLSFVNRGSIAAGGVSIKSIYSELGGSFTMRGSMDVDAVDCIVQGAAVSAGNDLSFQANTLKINQAQISTQTRLYLTVTNSLYDNGPTSSNTITCGDGFVVATLPSNPAARDLLGTAIRTKAGNYGPEVDHLWPAQDRGNNVSGYAGNLALGSLALVPGNFENLFPPLFVFGGTGTSNAIYVDFLDLSKLADYANEIQINPNLVIYYAAASLSFTPPNTADGIPQTPEEFLNGQFDGRLRWVSRYAGANSSVDVVVNGNQTIKVNKALRQSKIIDSDADGIANFYDASPFDGVIITAITPITSPAGYAISWKAAAGTPYRIEYRTNILSGGWQFGMMATNTTGVTKIWTVQDTNSILGNLQRYYRVTYDPNTF